MDCERKANKEFIEGYRFEKCGFCVSIKDKIVFEDYNLNSMRIEYVLRESILDLLKFFDEKKIEFNQIEIYGDIEYRFNQLVKFPAFIIGKNDKEYKFRVKVSEGGFDLELISDSLKHKK